MPQPRAGDFTGKVVDNSTGEGISGVVLTIDENITAITDKKGKFTVANLSPGEYRIKLQNTWYHEQIYDGQKYVGLADSRSYKMIPRELNGGFFYHSKRDSSNDIFCLNLANRTISKAFENAGDEKNPIFWEKNKILFEADYNRDDNLSDLYFLDLGKATSPQKLFPKYSNSRSVAVRENLIAFETKVGSTWEIVVYDTVADTYTEVAKGYNPAWNLSGTKLAYTKSDKLYVYDFATNSTLLFEYAGKVNFPSWRDDTTLAAEIWEGSGQPHRIALFDVNLPTIVTPLTFSENNSENHYHPVWSDDGELLFFSGNIAYSSRIDVYGIRFSEGEAAVKTILTYGSGDKRYFSYYNEDMLCW